MNKHGAPETAVGRANKMVSSLMGPIGDLGGREIEHMCKLSLEAHTGEEVPVKKHRAVRKIEKKSSDIFSKMVTYNMNQIKNQSARFTVDQSTLMPKAGWMGSFLGGSVASTETQDYEDVLSPTVLNAPICDICIIQSGETIPAGFHRLYKTPANKKANLNHGSGGHPIYLCIKKDTTGKLAPVTNIIVIYPDKNEYVPPGYFVVQRGKSACNVNTGTGGDRIYICFKKDFNGNPITDLQLIFPLKGEDVPISFFHIETSQSGLAANLNVGTGGLDAYLTYRQKLNRLNCLDADALSAATAVERFADPSPIGTPTSSVDGDSRDDTGSLSGSSHGVSNYIRNRNDSAHLSSKNLALRKQGATLSECRSMSPLRPSSFTAGDSSTAAVASTEAAAATATASDAVVVCAEEVPPMPAGHEDEDVFGPIVTTPLTNKYQDEAKKGRGKQHSSHRRTQSVGGVFVSPVSSPAAPGRQGIGAGAAALLAKNSRESLSPDTLTDAEHLAGPAGYSIPTATMIRHVSSSENDALGTNTAGGNVSSVQYFDSNSSDRGEGSGSHMQHERETTTSSNRSSSRDGADQEGSSNGDHEHEELSAIMFNKVVDSSGAPVDLASRLALRALLAATYVRQGDIAENAMNHLCTLLKGTAFFENDYKCVPLGGTVTMLDLTVEAVCDRFELTSEFHHVVVLHFLKDLIKMAGGNLSSMSTQRIFKGLTFLCSSYSTKRGWLSSGVDMPCEDYSICDITPFEVLRELVNDIVSHSETVDTAYFLPDGYENSNEQLYDYDTADEEHSLHYLLVRDVTEDFIEDMLESIETSHLSEAACFTIARKDSTTSSAKWWSSIASYGRLLFRDTVNRRSFSILCALCNHAWYAIRTGSNGSPVARDLGSKLVALEAITEFLMSAGEKMRASQVMGYQIRRIVVPCVLFNVPHALNDQRVFAKILKILTALWKKWRNHVRIEFAIICEQLITKLMQASIVQIKPVFQMYVIQEVINWFDQPHLLVEMFVNYDMDRKFVSHWNTFSYLVRTVCAIARRLSIDASAWEAHAAAHKSGDGGSDMSPSGAYNVTIRDVHVQALEEVVFMAKTLMDASGHAFLMTEDEDFKRRSVSAAGGWQEDDIDDSGKTGSPRVSNIARSSSGDNSTVLAVAAAVVGSGDGLGVSFHTPARRPRSRARSDASSEGERRMNSADREQVPFGITAMSISRSTDEALVAAALQSLDTESMLATPTETTRATGIQSLNSTTESKISVHTNTDVESPMPPPQKQTAPHSGAHHSTGTGSAKLLSVPAVTGAESPSIKKSLTGRKRLGSIRLRRAAHEESEQLIKKAIDIYKEKDSLAKAVKCLLKENFMPNTPQEIANFLRVYKNSFDPSAIGEFLGEGGRTKAEEEYWSQIRFRYTRAVSFVEMEVEPALRLYLTGCGFRMPGESQKIDRFVEAFVLAFWQDNSGTPYAPFKHPDTVHLLTYAIIMLNTDLHRANIDKKNKGKKMTVEDFIKNLRGQDQGFDIDSGLLTRIYNNIKNRPIEMEQKVTDGSQQASLVPSTITQMQEAMKQPPPSAEAREREEKKFALNVCTSLRDSEDLLRSLSNFYFRFQMTGVDIKISLDLVSCMFEAVWFNFKSVAETLLDSQTVTDLSVKFSALDTLCYALTAAIFLDLKVERMTLASQLKTFREQCEASPHFVDCLREVPDDSWYVDVENGSFLGSIPEIIGKVHQLTVHIKDTMQETTNYELTRQIAAKFEKKAKILENNTFYIRDGDLTKINRGGGATVYRFFLFSDYLLYAHLGGTMKKEYVVHEQLTLSKLSAMDASATDLSQCSFRIEHPVKSFTVIAESPSVKQQWLREIQQAISNCKRREVAIAAAKAKKEEEDGGASAAGGSSNRRMSIFSRIEEQQHAQEVEKQVSMKMHTGETPGTARKLNRQHSQENTAAPADHNDYNNDDNDDNCVMAVASSVPFANTPPPPPKRVVVFKEPSPTAASPQTDDDNNNNTPVVDGSLSSSSSAERNVPSSSPPCSSLSFSPEENNNNNTNVSSGSGDASLPSSPNSEGGCRNAVANRFLSTLASETMDSTNDSEDDGGGSVLTGDAAVADVDAMTSAYLHRYNDYENSAKVMPPPPRKAGDENEKK